MTAPEQNGAHGDDWPAIAPAIQALGAENERLRAELDAFRSALTAITDHHRPIPFAGGRICDGCSHLPGDPSPRHKNDRVFIDRPFPCPTYTAAYQALEHTQRLNAASAPTT